MSDLGNLSDFFKEGSLSNLDWLDVDEKAYRELDTLPKQNLDTVPDLEAQWSHEDRNPSAYFVPNRDLAGYPVDPRVPEAPSTMGDLSQAHGLLRTARLALMQSSDLRRWQETLRSRYAKDNLVQAKTALAGVLAERGLLGRYYIDAEDFPGCGQSQARKASQFVKQFAGEAKFVKTKTACEGCSHNVAVGGAHHCGVFHKQLVVDVPYTDQLAAKVEAEQQAHGRQASVGGDPKTRIKNAFLGSPVHKLSGTFSGQDNSGALIPASRLLRKVASVEAAQEEVASHRAQPILALLRRELLKGRSASEISRGLRRSFDLRDLEATKQYWGPLFKEAGLYGTIYTTQDSFADCREGADFLNRHASKVRAIVAGSKCSSCIFAQAGRCMLYGRKLVAKVDDLYTNETVAAVLDEHKMAGTISPYLVSQQWGTTPRESLQNIHKEASGYNGTRVETARMDIQQGFYGGDQAQRTGELTRRAIVTAAAKYLNEGLYGSELRQALQGQFDPRDLTAAASELKKVVAEQGLQGIYYVDPTVYADYGSGCKEAERLHRSRQAVKFAKVGSKCDSCVHQTRAGYCSVLNKSLVVEPPYLDKQAMQQAVLATGRSTEVQYSDLVNNGMSMIQEFELTGGSGELDLHPQGLSLEASIQFGNNEVDLQKL